MRLYNRYTNLETALGTRRAFLKAQGGAGGATGPGFRSTAGLVVLPVAAGFHFLTNGTGIRFMKKVALGFRSRGQQAGNVGNVAKKVRYPGHGSKAEVPVNLPGQSVPNREPHQPPCGMSITKKPLTLP